MKAALSTPQPAHGSPHPYWPGTSSTPLTSPRMLACSVGQPYPPKHSPAAQDARISTSPSYFGLVVESSADPRDSAAVPRDNWSPPSSSVKSFSTVMPKQMIPLDANPAFEAFRKGAHANHVVRSFSLGSAPFVGGPQTPPGSAQADVSPSTAPVAFSRPQYTRRSPQANTGSSSSVVVVPPGPSTALPSSRPPFRLRDSQDSLKQTGSKTDADAEVSSLHDSAYVSCDSKRNSEASIDPPFFPNVPRFDSPVQLDPAHETQPLAQPAAADVRGQPPPHFALNLGRMTMVTTRKGSLGAGPTPFRADTAPVTTDLEKGMMDVAQLKEIMDLDAAPSPGSNTPRRLLLIDVRVATYYAASRIRGALNMCIPTTLLKRATFTLQKMQLTFAKDEDQAVFSAWRDASYLVIYDNNSEEMRDAVAAMNMLRKFTNDGYKGQAFVLRGGFNAFEHAYPDLVDRESTSAQPCASSALSLNSSGPRRLSIAPVLGGVTMPCATANANPFFSNIRQNMDLADGVGRIELTLPPSIALASLPAWLREAADPADRGHKVSQKFLNIELAEQARMKNAFGVVQASMNGADPCAPVRISGVEMGGKNRYKDILPFEHARVRLQGRSVCDCDYINASHVRASRSNKRYIASQAPLPATFTDFWSMVWDEDVRVIVMLTAESEGGQVKCHPYWKNNDYGRLSLRLLSEKKVSLDIDKYRASSSASTAPTSEPFSASETGRRRAQTLVSIEGSTNSPASTGSFFGQAQQASSETPFVYIRRFALSHRGQAFSPMREVTQLHFPSWPDFGTPAQPSHLLALVELANAMQRAASATSTPQSMQSMPPTPSVRAAQPGSSVTDTGKLDSLFWPWHDEPERNPAPKPMVVHCSAGCGRTGTFCTVDSVVDMLKRQHQRAVRRASAAAGRGRRQSEDVVMVDADDSSNGATLDADKGFDPAWLDSDQVDLVARTVEDFRTQRLSMVQSLRQYVLCYEAVAEWVSKMQERRGGSGVRGPGRARSESLRMTMG